MSSSTTVNSPKIIHEKGAYHPINQMRDVIIDLLIDLGFEEINGPEIETENLILIC